MQIRRIVFRQIYRKCSWGKKRPSKILRPTASVETLLGFNAFWICYGSHYLFLSNNIVVGNAKSQEKAFLRPKIRFGHLDK